MDLDAIQLQFSRARLGGEPVPEDVQVLLAHAAELAERTGFALNWGEPWAPWLDTSYLREEERVDPMIVANLRAIEEVCGFIAFVATDGEDQYLGYWRGPTSRGVADSPIVFLDNEGMFELCRGSTLAEAILAMSLDEEVFFERRDYLRSLGLDLPFASQDELGEPDEADPPDKLHGILFDRYRG